LVNAAVKDFLKDDHVAVQGPRKVMGEWVALYKGRLIAHPNAALLFAASAVKITITYLLVKPIVNGLVHNEAVADVVVAMTPVQTSNGF
jgi:hypothetical protein